MELHGLWREAAVSLQELLYLHRRQAREDLGSAWGGGGTVYLDEAPLPGRGSVSPPQHPDEHPRHAQARLVTTLSSIPGAGEWVLLFPTYCT